MPSSVLVNGRVTAVPGVYGNARFAVAAGRNAPAGKVLGVVGNFPFLPNGKFSIFSSPSNLTRSIPGNPVVDQIAALAFSPASDPKVRGAATEVVLASVLPSTQAFLQLVDRYAVEAVRLKSRLWGELGNQTGVQLAADVVDSRLRDLAVGRSGTTETHPDLGSGAVLQVTYTPGPTVSKAYLSVRSPILDADTNEATAEIEVIAKIPALPGAAATTALAANERAADGKVTVQPSAAVTGNTTIAIVGINRATGLADAENVVIPDATAAPVTSTKDWSRVDSFSVSPADAATFQITWPVRRIGKTNASYVADVSAILNDVPLITSTIKNAQAAYMTIGALDFLASTDITSPTNVRADVWSEVETINARCLLAEADRALPTAAPTIARQGSNGVATLANASTAGSAFTSTTGLLPGDVLLFGTDSTQPIATLVVATVDGAATVTFESASPIAWTGGPVWLMRPATPRVPQAFSGGTVSVTAVNTGTDSLTVPAGPPLQNDDAVTIAPDVGGALPGNLAVNTTYYVVSAAATTVKLSASPGGSPVDLDTGFAGTNTITRAAQTRYMSGGADGVETQGSRDACFAALRQSETAVLVPLATSATLVQACLDHASYMAGPGARELNVWAGAPANTALDALLALAQGYNSRHLSLCGQEVRMLDSRGRRVWFGPQWQALQCAAMQAAVGIAVPITFKRPRALEVRSPVTWDGTKDIERLIMGGIVVYMKDNQGLKVARAITTHLASQDVAQTEVSANESVNWSIRDLRDFMVDVIGESSADIEQQALKGIAIGRLRKQKADKRITDFAEDRVDAKRINDVVRIEYPLKPAVPNNYVILEPSIETVVFEISLS